MSALRPECRFTPWSALSNPEPPAIKARPRPQVPIVTNAMRTVLRQWKENSRNQIRKGQAPRLFTDPELPAEVVEFVWDRLQYANTKAEVDAAFRAD